MNKAWTDLFSSNEKKEKIEDKVYCCTVCNDDQVRFTNAGNYASHMTIHKFHKGFDPTLPKPTARKGFSLPKLQKKKIRKSAPKFKNKDEALQHVREKSQKRHKIKKKDYPSMIQSYMKAKKEHKIKEWGLAHGIKNPTKRVSSWKKSIKKQALKEAQIE